MITKRLHADRGHTKYGGWLDSRHTFSFGHYYDEDHMGFGPLRVINEDKVRAGAGFDPHGHRDMEIISYVIDGALEHRDSMGNGSVIQAGDVQRLSAGTGVMHSEYNASKEAPVHFLQIWIEPDAQGHTPGYAQESFADIKPEDGLVLVASRQGDGRALSLNQDVEIYLAEMAPGAPRLHPLRAGRKAWLHVISGQAAVNGERLSAGDALGITHETAVTISGGGDAGGTARILLFDMEG